MYSITRWVSPTLYTVDPVLLPSVNPIKCHEEVLALRPMFPPKCFDKFPLCLGMLRRFRCVHIFLYKLGNFTSRARV